MSLHEGRRTVDSYTATAALTTLYTAVKADTTAGNVVVSTAATERCIGVTNSTATSAGYPVAVVTAGDAYAIADTGGWTLGDALTPSTAGVLLTTTTGTNLVCAIAGATVSAGEIGAVTIIEPVEYSILTGS